MTEQSTPSNARKLKANGKTDPSVAALEGGPELAGGPNLNEGPFADIEAALGLEDDGMQVSEVLATVECRKPRPTEFFRRHVDPDTTRTAYVFLDREEIGSPAYLVLPAVRPLIVDHLRPVMLTYCVNRQGEPFIWPISLPDPDVGRGRATGWTTTALEAAERAKDKWTKMTAGKGKYQVFTAENPNLSGPKWPDKPFSDIIALAFREGVIDRPDHPIVERLRGLK